MTYSYDPTQIKKRGKDQMRFELSDTIIDGGTETCALSDEEYTAVLDGLANNRRAWQCAKLSLLEAIVFKMSYQVNTKIDVLSYAFGDRAELWRKLYETLKKELKATAAIPTLDPSTENKRPYFYTGMHENINATE